MIKLKLYLLFALIISLMSILGCTSYINPMNIGEKQTPNLKEIEKYSKLEFPQNTKVNRSTLSSWLDIIIFATLEMDQAQFEEFISQPVLKDKLSSSDRCDVTNELAKYSIKAKFWWKPDSVTDFFAYKMDVPENTDGSGFGNLSLLISNDSSNTHTVYLYVCVDA